MFVLVALTLKIWITLVFKNSYIIQYNKLYETYTKKYLSLALLIYYSLISQVINYDLPTTFIIYTHRIGRTGRVKLGDATSFVEMNKDGSLITEIIKVKT